MRSESGNSALQAEVERLAPVGVLVDLVRREHEAECVDDVLARLFACSALANRAGNLVDACCDPPFLIGFVEQDRQPELPGSAQARVRPRRA